MKEFSKNVKVILTHKGRLDVSPLTVLDVKKRELVIEERIDDNFSRGLKSIKFLINVDGIWKEYETENILGNSENGIEFRLEEFKEMDFTKDLRTARY